MENYCVYGEGKVVIGNKTSLGEGVKFIFKKPGTITLGDYVTIGDAVKIIVEGGNVSIEDWSAVHSNSLVICKKGVEIGQHCWIGQNSILDGTGGLKMENGVRVGMYSQIWSHIAAGEQIEGCVFYSASPVHLCADVWLVGSCTVGSGVRIGRRAVCLSGSNVTKDVAENTVVAGVPARLREGVQAYVEKSLDEKFDMMATWADDFCIGSDGAFQVHKNAPDCLVVASSDQQRLYVFKFSRDYESHALNGAECKFCIQSKRYAKTFLNIEEKLMRYLSGNKARFYREDS